MEYIWYKNGKPVKFTADIEGKLISKKIISDSEYVTYDYYDSGELEYVTYYKNGEYHRDGDKPAVVLYHRGGGVKHNEYFKNGELHRDGDKPAVTEWHTEDNKKSESYYKNGKLHREGDKPAVTEWHWRNKKKYESYYEDGEKHRDADNDGDKPAEVWYSDDGVSVLDVAYYDYGKQYSP